MDILNKNTIRVKYLKTKSKRQKNIHELYR